MAKKRSKSAAGLALVPALVHEQLQTQPAADLTRADTSPTVREAITAFEQLIGGRAKLLEALSTCSNDPLVEQVLTAIGHPDYDQDPTYSLAAICREAHITPFQLFTAFERAATARGQLLSKVEAANASPAVTREVIKQALPHETICLTCNGVGTLTADPTKEIPNPSPQPCHACNGVGGIRQPGDLESQKLALDLAGLKKGSGPLLAVQNTIHPPPAPFSPGSLEELQQAMSAVLYKTRGRPEPEPQPPAVDADILPAKESV